MLDQEYEIMNNFETNYWWYVGLHELVLRIIARQAENNERLKILDAGCGTGRLLTLLQAHQTTGFDYSPEAIKFCESKNLKNISLQDISTWTSSPKYDVIISNDVICSTGITNHEEIIANFAAALNPNGILILNLPAFELLRRNHDKAVFVGKRFRIREIKKQLRSAGLSVEKASYRHPMLFFVILLKKILQRITHNNSAASDLNHIPHSINKLLIYLHRLENFFVLHKFPIFFGSSAFITARKK